MELCLPVQGGDFSQAGEASATFKRALQQIGLAPTLIRSIVIAAYEAEMNIVIHADHGSMQLIIWPGSVEVVAVDSGPGIVDVERAMQVGYSTATDIAREMGFGAGLGLPNMRRNAHEMLVSSVADVGTTVRLRFNI